MVAPCRRNASKRSIPEDPTPEANCKRRTGDDDRYTQFDDPRICQRSIQIRYRCAYVVRFTAACHHVPPLFLGPMRLMRYTNSRTLTMIPIVPTKKAAQQPLFFFFKSICRDKITGIRTTNSTRSVARFTILATIFGMTIPSRGFFPRSKSRPFATLSYKWKKKTAQVGTTDHYQIQTPAQPTKPILPVV